MKNPTFRGRGKSTKNQDRGGDCLKRAGLGQFADLRRGLARKRDVVFLRGGGVDTPMHTMNK